MVGRRSITEAAEYLQIPAGLVEAAVAYYGEYRDEIDAEIELNGPSTSVAGRRPPPASRP